VQVLRHLEERLGPFRVGFVAARVLDATGAPIPGRNVTVGPGEVEVRLPLSAPGQPGR
jgi:hypothetical protein